MLLWYDDGSPALVEGRVGEGRTLLFTSTLDRDWNDLAIRPGYLPLVQQMVRYLSRVALYGTSSDVKVGRLKTFQPAKGTRQVHLVLPDGGELNWSARELAGKPRVEIPVERPGFYQLGVAAADGVLHTLERESFMANVDPAESDLRKLGAGARPARLQAAGAKATRRVELWHGLGALLLLFLVFESFLIRRG